MPSADPRYWSLTHCERYAVNTYHWSNVEPFIHIIKLDRIQSRIHKAVFRVDKDVIRGSPDCRSKLDRKIDAIRTDLDQWINEYPQTPKRDSKSTWMYDPESAYLDAGDFYSV